MCLIFRNRYIFSPKAKLKEKLKQTGVVQDIKQRLRFLVAIKGQNRYIIFNHLRVRFNSISDLTGKQRKC